MYKSIAQESAGGLVLTVPEDLKTDLGLAAGSEIEMEIDTEHLVVRMSRPQYTLQELLDQCDPTVPISDEDREWEAMKPVGRELL